MGKFDPRPASNAWYLTSQMGVLNAIVVSQKTLGKILGVSQKTIQRAVATLVEDRWINVINLNGAGTMSAYVVKRQVGWGRVSDPENCSVFSAVVIADRADQSAETLTEVQLRKIPTL